MNRRRFGSSIGLAAVLVGAVGCSSAQIAASPTRTGTPTSSASNASPSPGRTDSPKPTPSSKASAPSSQLTVIRVPGYTYTDLPDQLKGTIDALDASGLVSATAARGVKDGSGNLVAAIILARYNPKLTVLLEKKSTSKILDGAVTGIKALVPGKTEVRTYQRSGVQVRVIRTTNVSTAVCYRRGGLLTQVTGPTPTVILNFLSAYLAAATKS